MTGLVTAFIVFFIIDPVFLSVGSIKSAKKSEGLGGLIGGIPDLGELGDITGGAGSSSKELALYENILISRKNIEETIIRFNLNEEWDFKYMQEAVKHFRENILEIKKDKIAGTMEIGIYDINPERAQKVADFMIFQLNKINVELNILNAKNNREFLEERYKIVKEQLTKAEDSLKQYQNENGIAPDITVKAAAQSEVTLDIEIKSEEVKLDLLKKILAPNESEISMQSEKIALLKKQLSDIQNSPDNSGSLSLKGAPDLLMNYFRLQRDVEIQNKILTFIIPILEQAKIEEKKETPTVLVLDNPSLPEKKVKPKRLTITLIAMFLVGILAFSYYVFKKKFSDFKIIQAN
ncbi:MAG: GNVR domain-containing protein [Ignavibacteria bacterium]